MGRVGSTHPQLQEWVSQDGRGPWGALDGSAMSNQLGQPQTILLAPRE